MPRGCLYIAYRLPPIMPPGSGGFPCSECPKVCKSPRGLKQHTTAMHQQSSRLGVPLSDVERHFHPLMTGKSNFCKNGVLKYFPGRPCDKDGIFLSPGTPPILPPPKSKEDWSPFHSRAGFELAELLYKKAEMSQPNIDHLLNIWSATLAPHNDEPPIAGFQDLHAQIDAIDLGFTPWKSSTVQYQGRRPENSAAPRWMDEEY